jgi:predicted deacylase
MKTVNSEKSKPFELAGHTVLPGERLQFDLPAANLYTHTPLDLPVEIIHGRRSGPVLLVCAAIHGDELNGVEIIRRMRSFRSLGRLHGTLVLVPVVNLFGFIHQSRYLPDRRDLNRCFPGLERGSLASRVARRAGRQRDGHGILHPGHHQLRTDREQSPT